MTREAALKRIGRTRNQWLREAECSKALASMIVSGKRKLTDQMRDSLARAGGIEKQAVLTFLVITKRAKR